MTARIRMQRRDSDGGRHCFLDDRIEMPVYDESIFYPEKIIHNLGLTDEDIHDLAEFMRWHINQRNRGLEMKRLINVLSARRDQLLVRRKTDLLQELQSLEQIPI